MLIRSCSSANWKVETDFPVSYIHLGESQRKADIHFLLLPLDLQNYVDSVVRKWGTDRRLPTVLFLLGVIFSSKDTKKDKVVPIWHYFFMGHGTTKAVVFPNWLLVVHLSNCRAENRIDDSRDDLNKLLPQLTEKRLARNYLKCRRLNSIRQFPLFAICFDSSSSDFWFVLLIMFVCPSYFAVINTFMIQKDWLGYWHFFHI